MPSPDDPNVKERLEDIEAAAFDLAKLSGWNKDHMQCLETISHSAAMLKGNAWTRGTPAKPSSLRWHPLWFGLPWLVIGFLGVLIWINHQNHLDLRRDVRKLVDTYECQVKGK